uniref:Putative secreted protein n=1 Tax=Anopheles darlingi TaxID=43151 RepID=A0A2M4DGI3_ANODA
MNETTGFALIPWLYCIRYAAAFSSATPPISPIRMIPLVSGSFRNTSRQSIKSVPLNGSPPIPTHSVWPRPTSVVW